MRDVSFCSDSFVSPATTAYSERALACLLWALVFANESTMLDPKRPQVPPLYRSGVRWEREEPRPGRTGCAGGNGQERFFGARQVIAERAADCEDLAAYRTAELRLGRVPQEPGLPPRAGHPPVTVCQPPYPMAARGVNACPAFFSRTMRPGFVLYHIVVAWCSPSGRVAYIEDPSRVLGMGANTPESRSA